MKTTIPVIILNYNSTNHVIKNIESILKYNTQSSIDYKFIIIDNNSQEEGRAILNEYISKFDNKYLEFNDKTDLNKIKDIELLKSYDVIYIQMKNNYGYSYSNNIGLKISRKLGYEYCIISNPDTRVIDNDSIKNMLDIISNEDEIGVVFPKVIDPNGNHQEIMYEINFYSLVIYPILYPILFIPTKIQRKLKLKLNTKKNYTKIYTSIGCFFMVKLIDFDTVNYFDDSVFLYGEEDILALKMKSINKLVVCANNSTILHNHIILNKENPKTDNLRRDALIYLLKNYLKYSNNKIKLVGKAQHIYRKYYASIVDKIKNR